jgi:hypothetical protein
MYVESAIASEIVQAFIDAKRPIIPIFDSFLVWEEDTQMLEELMVTSFQEVLGIEWGPSIH